MDLELGLVLGLGSLLSLERERALALFGSGRMEFVGAIMGIGIGGRRFFLVRVWVWSGGASRFGSGRTAGLRLELGLGLGEEYLCG